MPLKGAESGVGEGAEAGVAVEPPGGAGNQPHARVRARPGRGVPSTDLEARWGTHPWGLRIVFSRRRHRSAVGSTVLGISQQIVASRRCRESDSTGTESCRLKTVTTEWKLAPTGNTLSGCMSHQPCKVHFNALEIVGSLGSTPGCAQQDLPQGVHNALAHGSTCISLKWSARWVQVWMHTTEPAVSTCCGPPRCRRRQPGSPSRSHSGALPCESREAYNA